MSNSFKVKSNMYSEISRDYFGSECKDIPLSDFANLVPYNLAKN